MGVIPHRKNKRRSFRCRNYVTPRVRKRARKAWRSVVQALSYQVPVPPPDYGRADLRRIPLRDLSEKQRDITLFDRMSYVLFKLGRYRSLHARPRMLIVAMAQSARLLTQMIPHLGHLWHDCHSNHRRICGGKSNGPVIGPKCPNHWAPWTCNSSTHKSLAKPDSSGRVLPGESRRGLP